MTSNTNNTVEFCWVEKDTEEEEYVLCDGCEMSVCKYGEEPNNRDDWGEPLCEECYGFLCEETWCCDLCDGDCFCSDGEVSEGPTLEGAPDSVLDKIDSGVVEDEDCKTCEEEVVPTCDYCDKEEDDCEEWNGETGCCVDCEDTIKTWNELVLAVNSCDCEDKLPKVPNQV